MSAIETAGSTPGADLTQGREAFARRDWAVAFSRLRGAGELGPEDTMAFATAAFLVGEPDAAIRAWQHGYTERVGMGDSVGAARFALWLGLVLSVRGERAIAAGWVARAERILQAEPDDIGERGFLLIHEFYAHLGRGDLVRAEETAGRVVLAGRRFGAPDLVAQGLMSQGRMAIMTGRVREGLALLDEAMVGISAAEVSPIFAGLIYCALIEACQEISDFGRMSAWTHALTRWCDAQPGLAPFTGQCMLHRGQILRLHGAFDDALTEFSRAQHRAEVGAPPGGAAALALAERGDLLRLRGKLSDAETAYRQSADLGHDPQPSLALCWLARGRSADAVAAVHRLLAEVRGPVSRSRLLGPAVEILLSTGDLGEARRCAEELTGIASAFGFAGLQAAGAYAIATVAIAADEPGQALAAAREACTLWGGIEAPYEAARARVVIGQALRGLGDEATAAGELAAARTAFLELGAAPALSEVDQLLGRRLPGGLTERELEVLRLVAEGRSNPDIARVLVLSRKTVARHLSNIFTKLDVSSRTAAAAYAHEHGLTV